MAIEHAPAEKRGLYGSWVQIGVPVGTLIANLAFLAMSAGFTGDTLQSWGWRIPFLASSLLIIIGIYIRLSIHETPVFEQTRRNEPEVKIPLLTLIRKYWKEVLLGGIATMSTGSSFNIIAAFGLTYGTRTLDFTRSEMLAVVLASCALCILLLPLFGALSDRIGRKPVIIGGIIAEAIVAFPMFWLMDTRELWLVYVGYGLLMTAFAANYGPIATFLAELFGTRVRYSGLSVAYMLSGLLGSATTPVVTTALLSWTGKGSSVAWYMIGSALISLLALLLLGETFRRQLTSTTAR